MYLEALYSITYCYQVPDQVKAVVCHSLTLMLSVYDVNIGY